jgi:hypothetical protein
VRSAAAHGQTAEHIVGHPRRLGLDPVAHADVGRIVALQAQRRFFFRHLQMAAEEFASFFLIPPALAVSVFSGRSRARRRFPGAP